MCQTRIRSERGLLEPHDLAVEAADVPAVQHHDLAHVEEQQLDEVHELWHWEREDEVEDIARLAQDLIKANEDAQVRDDAEVLKHAEGTGDHGAAHTQRGEGQAHHEWDVDDAVVACVAWIADLEVVVLGLAVTAHGALVSHCAGAAVHGGVLVEEQRWAGLELVCARAPIGFAQAEERPATLQRCLTDN